MKLQKKKKRCQPTANIQRIQIPTVISLSLTASQAANSLLNLIIVQPSHSDPPNSSRFWPGSSGG